MQGWQPQRPNCRQLMTAIAWDILRSAIRTGIVVVKKAGNIRLRVPSSGAGPPGTSRMIDATQFFLPLLSKLGKSLDERRGGLFTGISQLYGKPWRATRARVRCDVQGCASHPGVLPVNQKPAFSFWGKSGSKRVQFLFLPPIPAQPTADNIKLSPKKQRPSLRWRAQRALDAVQHAGTEIETGTKRSRQGIGIGTRPATRTTEIGGKRAVMLTRTVDHADLPLHGVRHTTMEMVPTSTLKRMTRTTIRTATGIGIGTVTVTVTVTGTVAHVRRTTRTSGAVVTVGHAARADPPRRAHDLDPDPEIDPDNALEHAIQSGAQVETGP